MNCSLIEAKLHYKTHPAIPDKIFGTKWSNPVKLDKRRKVCYLFYACFLTAIGKV